MTHLPQPNRNSQQVCQQFNPRGAPDSVCKNSGSLFGVPKVKALANWNLYWGPFISGNYQMYCYKAARVQGPYYLGPWTLRVVIIPPKTVLHLLTNTQIPNYWVLGLSRKWKPGLYPKPYKPYIVNPKS